MLSRCAGVAPGGGLITWLPPRLSEKRTRWPAESNRSVTDVADESSLGNAASTVVAPEPLERVRRHSPPKSTGRISGMNARIAESPRAGVKTSVLTRVNTSVAPALIGAPVAAAGVSGTADAAGCP